MKGTRAVAQRIANAENGFVEFVRAQIGCTQAEAEAVLSVYRWERLINIGAVDGQWRIKHGAFLDKDVLQSVVDQNVAV